MTAVVRFFTCCRWVAALKLLVGILRAEHRAALSVWPSEYTAAEPAFNEVVSRSVVAATHAGAFIVASKRMPEKVSPDGHYPSRSQVYIRLYRRLQGLHCQACPCLCVRLEHEGCLKRSFKALRRGRSRFLAFWRARKTATPRQVSWMHAAQVFGLLDMQEQVEAALANMALTLESSSASNILADFTQLAAMIRQEVTLA